MAALTGPPHRYALVNARTGAVLASRLGVARSTWRRLRGILGRRSLQPGDGTRFLTAPWRENPRLPFDLLLLDRDSRVLHAVHSLPAFCLQEATREVHSVVELPPGTLARLDARVGDLLEMVAQADAQPA